MNLVVRQCIALLEVRYKNVPGAENLFFHRKIELRHSIQGILTDTHLRVRGILALASQGVLSRER